MKTGIVQPASKRLPSGCLILRQEAAKAYVARLVTDASYAAEKGSASLKDCHVRLSLRGTWLVCKAALGSFWKKAVDCC